MRDETAPVISRTLNLDARAEADRIATMLRGQVFDQLKRRGVVVGISGGIDSSVAAALAVRGLGRERVVGVMMPEADSSGESLRLGHRLAVQLGIDTIVEDITSTLEAAGCYARRDEAIRLVIPEYTSAFMSKLVLTDGPHEGVFRVPYIVVESPLGVRSRARLNAEAYRTVVAATNFKQRVRKMFEYFHADRLQYAVLGTPNRLEYDQGFFVKNGDGAADLKPLAHLYKSQVYQLAEFLDVPAEIQERPPTTDTYSLEQSQEEFYFAVPLQCLDACLFGLNTGMTAADTAREAGLAEAQVARVYREIESKRRATRYLHMPPLMVVDVFERPEGG
jgi:NAD+ synthase